MKPIVGHTWFPIELVPVGFGLVVCTFQIDGAWIWLDFFPDVLLWSRHPSIVGFHPLNPFACASRSSNAL